MGCVIIRQAIRRGKRRYNLRPALCYALNINNKINGRFAVLRLTQTAGRPFVFWRRLIERGRPYERFI